MACFREPQTHPTPPRSSPSSLLGHLPTRHTQRPARPAAAGRGLRRWRWRGRGRGRVLLTCVSGTGSTDGVNAGGVVGEVPPLLGPPRVRARVSAGPSATNVCSWVTVDSCGSWGRTGQGYRVRLRLLVGDCRLVRQLGEDRAGVQGQITSARG